MVEWLEGETVGGDAYKPSKLTIAKIQRARRILDQQPVPVEDRHLGDEYVEEPTDG